MKQLHTIMVCSLMLACHASRIAVEATQPPRSELLCGPRSLYVVCQLLGVPATTTQIEDLFDVGSRGCSMYDIFEAAQLLGFSTMAARLDYAELASTDRPCIASVKKDLNARTYNHFLVVNKTQGQKVSVIDYPNPPVLMSRAEFEKIWTGEAIVFALPQYNPDLASAVCSGRIKSPRARVNTLLRDFEEVHQGELLTPSFEMRNVGQELLKITKIEGSCDLIINPLVSQLQIPFGETIEIEAIYDTSGDVGTVLKQITLDTNDPISPQIVLRIAASVVEDITVLPGVLNFGEIDPDQPVTRIVWVRNNSESPLHIEAIQCSSGFLIARELDREELHKILDPRAQPTLDALPVAVTIQPGTDAAVVSENIIVVTNNQRKPKIQIPVVGRILPIIQALPEKVFFGVVPKQRELCKKVRITALQHTTFKVTRVESSVDDVSVAAKEAGNGSVYEIEIMLRTGTTVGWIKGNITIYTDCPKQNAVNIPVSALVM